MKRIYLLLLALVMIICMVGCGGSNPTVDIEYYDDDFSSEELPSSSEETLSSEETSSLPVQNNVDTTAWELALVNAANPIEADYEPELAQIKDKYASSSTRFDARAVEALNNMCDAAYEAGVWLWIKSAYRSNYTITHTFNSKVNEIMANNAGMTKEEAENVAIMTAAKPGTSEHQLGLAVDFNSNGVEFLESKYYTWLNEHAHEYGFIMRYPNDKHSITGVADEPSHYRYVGVEAATALKESGLCLEEYLGMQ